MKKNFINNFGITLIILAISVVIMLILTTVVISTFKVIKMEQTDDVIIASEVSKLKENYTLYTMRAETFTKNYDITDLDWDGESLPINTAQIEHDGEEDRIENILGTIPAKLNNKLVIKNGILYFFNLKEEEMVWIEKCDLPLYKKALVDYSVGKIDLTDKLSISIDENGYIILNGRSYSEEYFIKVTNGLDYATSSNSTEKQLQWIKESPTLIQEGTKIIHKVEIVSGTITGKAEINMVLRNANNTAVLNCQMNNQILDVIDNCTSDIKFSYVYIAKNSICNNLIIKPIVEEYNYVTEEDTVPLIPQKVQYSYLNCQIVDKNTIILDGKTTQNFYVKISDGFDVRKAGMSDNDWVRNGTRFAKKGQEIYMQAEFEDLSTVISTETNMCLRNIDNVLDTKIEMMKQQEGVTKILDQDCSAVYLYIRAGSVFNQSKIKFVFDILDNK